MFIFLLILTFLISFSSAEIIINQQPGELYNLGGTITTPLTVKSSTTLIGILNVNLICEGAEVNYYKNGVNLAAGEEKNLEASLILSKEMLNTLRGNCKIKASIGIAYTLSNEFKISGLINIDIKEKQENLNPGDVLLVKGNAIREDGKAADGFARLEVILDNSTDTLIQEATVNKGVFSLETSLPENLKAGRYLVKLTISEKDSGEETNKGFVNYNLQVNQIPTSVEIFFENTEITPGENLKVKAILHDQSGEKIDSEAIITVKNSKNKILIQETKSTDEFLEFPIAYNEAPATWSVYAVSSQLSSENTFKIKAVSKVNVEIINKTLLITNVGNVRYNELIPVKIGTETLTINASLKVDEVKKYELTAPDGEYEVEVLGASRTVMLTGNAIDIREATEGFVSLARHPLSWVFLIIVLGGVAFIIFKRGYKKSFFGYIGIGKKKEEKESVPLEKNSLVKSQNRALLSLSIKGEKQNATFVCIKIKNLKEIQSKKGNAEEALQKVVELAESQKAVTYENQENIFFILAPLNTKTFKNEMPAIHLAQSIKKILEEHNRMFKHRVEFGLSVNYGTIVAKQDPEAMKFMSMGTLINTSKKIAAVSRGEVLLSEEVRDKVITETKLEKQNIGSVTAYKIVEVKNREGTKNFIDSFLKRQKRDENK